MYVYVFFNGQGWRIVLKPAEKVEKANPNNFSVWNILLTGHRVYEKYI